MSDTKELLVQAMTAADKAAQGRPRPDDDNIADIVSKALRRAYSLGQTYWQQADSDSYAQNRRSDETQRKVDGLVDETRDALFAHCNMAQREAMQTERQEMKNGELRAALESKLRPGAGYTNQDLTAFALGVEWAQRDATPDEVIELAAALEIRAILEEIKAVAATVHVATLPTPFQAAWHGCCEEIFYRATGQQWHMDEDDARRKVQGPTAGEQIVQQALVAR